MAIPVTLTPQNLDPNVCYANDQARLNDFVQHTSASVPVTFTPVVISSTAPGPDQRDNVWIKVDGDNAILDVQTFSNGAWNGLPQPWITGEFKYYDPSLYSPSAPWYACDGTHASVPDLRGRFIVATGQRQLPGGSVDVATNFTYGLTGGTEQYTLVGAQQTPHDHGPDNVTAPGATEFVYRGSGGGLGTVGGGGPSSPRTSIALGNGSGGTDPHPNIPPYYALAIMQWRPDL